MPENSMQQPLFVENINEALSLIVKALGGNKKVGLQLWPNLTSDGAGSRMADCLNHDRREKLDPSEVIWLLRQARQINFHSAMDFICTESGYDKPHPVEPETEQAALMREFIESTKQQTRNLERFERLANASMLRSVA